MARLLPAEAVEAYLSGAPSPYVVDYDPLEHDEAMLDVATGVVGAMLKLGLASLSGPEIGSPIPFVACNVPGDVVRLFVAPVIVPYGEVLDSDAPYIKKAREHVKLTALSYQGDLLRLDTKKMDYTNHRRLAAELQYQATLLSSSCPEPESDCESTSCSPRPAAGTHTKNPT